MDIILPKNLKLFNSFEIIEKILLNISIYILNRFKLFVYKLKDIIKIKIYNLNVNYYSLIYDADSPYFLFQ